MPLGPCYSRRVRRFRLRTVWNVLLVFLWVFGVDILVTAAGALPGQHSHVEGNGLNSSIFYLFCRERPPLRL